MATPKQIEANRRNAEKSTGPMSADGKERASRNAITHGLTAAKITAVDESAELYEAFRRHITGELSPRSVLEAMLAEQVAQTLWKLRRVAQAEGVAIEKTSEDLASYHRQTGVGDISRVVIRDLKANNSALLKVQLYQVRLERTLHRTLAELRLLRKEAAVEVEDDNSGARSGSLSLGGEGWGEGEARESRTTGLCGGDNPDAATEVADSSAGSVGASTRAVACVDASGEVPPHPSPLPQGRGDDDCPSATASAPVDRLRDGQSVVGGDEKLVDASPQGIYQASGIALTSSKSDKTNPIPSASDGSATSDHFAEATAAHADSPTEYSAGSGTTRGHSDSEPARCLDPEQAGIPCMAAAQLCDTKALRKVRNA